MRTMTIWEPRLLILLLYADTPSMIVVCGVGKNYDLDYLYEDL